MLRLSCLLGIVLSIACVDDGPDPLDGDLQDQSVGHFNLEWNIFDGDARQSCIDVHAESVALVALSNDAERIETVGCFAGFGESALLPSGNYEVTAQLVDGAGNVLASIGLGPLEVLPGETTPLGTLDFRMGELQ